MQVQSQRYGLEPDDDATEYSEALVVNITDDEVVFKIATTPGSKARRYRLAPFGRPGSSVHLQEGYTKEYRGAGREIIKPIVEAITKRESYPGGPAMAQVVHEDKAPQARRAWLATFAKRDAEIAKAKTIELKVSAEQLAAHLPQPQVQPRAAAVPAPRSTPKPIVEDFPEDPIEPPHPDDEPIVADGPPSAAQLGASAPPFDSEADDDGSMPPSAMKGRSRY